MSKKEADGLAKAKTTDVIIQGKEGGVKNPPRKRGQLYCFRIKAHNGSMYEFHSRKPKDETTGADVVMIRCLAEGTPMTYEDVQTIIDNRRGK